MVVQGEEIDLIVRDEKSATFIEVKWSDLDEEDINKILERLKEKRINEGKESLLGDLQEV